MRLAEWIAVEPLESIQGTVNVGSATYGTEPVKCGLPGPQHIFCIHLIFRGGGEEAT